MPTFVRSHAKVDRVARADVWRWAERMLARLDRSASELSILLTDDDEIRRLNRDYRGEDARTDVLAFAMLEGDRLPGSERADLLGDVVISIDSAQRQARRAGRDLDAEVRTLLAHGLLHLVGFDHPTPAKLSRMRKWTRELCRAAEGSNSQLISGT